MAALKVVIVGGGIAGLAAAYRLQKTCRQEHIPLDLNLLESSSRFGGIISTQRYEGAVIENGPDSFITTKPAALDLCRELGLGKSVIATNCENRRALVARGKNLYPLPEGFFMMAPSQILPVLQSPLFSAAGKARMLLDVVLPARQDIDDESLSSFVKRRLGKEVLERVAQPMMGGIYTGDPERLSLRSTMPQFLQFERDHGSVIVGLQEDNKAKAHAQKNDAGARYSMFVTLDGGMEMLVDALVREIVREIGREIGQEIGRGNLKTNCRVSRVRRGAAGWHIECESGESLDADAVVIAVPTPVAAKLLAQTDACLSQDLASIEYASSFLFNLVFRRKDVPHSMKGFGFIVPAIEEKNLLACTFSSIKFPNRAPAGMVTLRAFLGGALNPQLAELSEDDALSAILRDLRFYLGIKSDPLWYNSSRWRESMPQYVVGHAAVINSINRRVEQLGGLYLAGNGYAGVGLPDCIRSGEDAARRICQRCTIQ